MKYSTVQRGFTLIELLLYVSLSAMLLLAIAGVLFMVLQARVKNQTITEVEQQGVQAMQLMTQTARNAQNIHSPDSGSSAESVSFDVVATAADPTVFSVSSGVLRMTEGASPAVALTNSQVSVTAFSVQNVSRAGTPGAVRIQFTLSYAAGSGRNEYAYSKTFYATATLRQ